MGLLPKDLEDMLGTKEEFEKAQKCQNCPIKEFCASNRIDEDGDDLLGEKLKQEDQDNLRDDLDDLGLLDNEE